MLDANLVPFDRGPSDAKSKPNLRRVTRNGVKSMRASQGRHARAHTRERRAEHVGAPVQNVTTANAAAAAASLRLPRPSLRCRSTSLFSVTISGPSASRKPRAPPAAARGGQMRPENGVRSIRKERSGLGATVSGWIGFEKTNRFLRLRYSHRTADRLHACPLPRLVSIGS